MEFGNKREKGIFMVLCGASLWGASGVAVQYLFQYKLLDPTWLAGTRMLIAGFIMLVICSFSGEELMGPWRQPRYRKQLIVFGIFGMMATQYTYYLAINHGNARRRRFCSMMAVIVLLYSVWRARRSPSAIETVSVFLAMMGTYLLIRRAVGTSWQFPPRLLSGEFCRLSRWLSTLFSRANC